MAISESNVVIVYREGDFDSESLADHYLDTYDLGTNHKIAVPCSNNEILNSETEFNNEVLNPLKSQIDNLESGNMSIWCVVLGYRVPGGYYDNGDVVSSTSRISRIHHTQDKKINNGLYDRKEFKRFDNDDKDFALITSRIDSYSLESAKDIINRSTRLEGNSFANGRFYLDPYSNKSSNDANTYQEALLDFHDQVLPLLNLDILTTNEPSDNNTDPTFPFVDRDSFIWSWFRDRSSISFFNDSESFRSFFYNADNDGAAAIRDLGERRWPILAIRSGYMAVAGSMSNPGFDGFLFPTPFFESLLRNSTIGEAFLFSQPYLDWTLTFVGDPLAKISFPAQGDDIDSEAIEDDESIRLMSMDIARAIAFYFRKSELLEESRQTVVWSDDVQTSVDLLNPFHQLYQKNSIERMRTEFLDVVNSFFRYIEARNYFTNLDQPNPAIDDYLSDQEKQFSRLFLHVLDDNNIISEENLLPEGWWTIEFELTDDAGEFAFYHFRMQVSNDGNFEDIVLDLDSRDNPSNWSYEKFVNDFRSIPQGGVSSNFVSRRVKFEPEPSQYLSRGQILFIRVQQIDQRTEYDFREYTDIVFT